MNRSTKRNYLGPNNESYLLYLKGAISVLSPTETRVASGYHAHTWLNRVLLRRGHCKVNIQSNLAQPAGLSNEHISPLRCVGKANTNHMFDVGNKGSSEGSMRKLKTTPLSDGVGRPGAIMRFLFPYFSLYHERGFRK